MSFKVFLNMPCLVTLVNGENGAQINKMFSLALLFFSHFNEKLKF